jgi:hypothetical protein
MTRTAEYRFKGGHGIDAQHPALMVVRVVVLVEDHGDCAPADFGLVFWRNKTSRTNTRRNAAGF